MWVPSSAFRRYHEIMNQLIKVYMALHPDVKSTAQHHGTNVESRNCDGRQVSFVSSTERFRALEDKFIQSVVFGHFDDVSEEQHANGIFCAS